MQFLCLGYLEPAKMDDRPKAEIESIMSGCGAHLEELYQTGKVRMDTGLDTKVVSLRRADGKLRVIDGPFTEAKEMIGSAFLIEAQDLEEAVRIASMHPAVQIAEGEVFGWGIEIRPIHYFKADAN
ncbi:YciI family protein [Paenibacillus soyae]|uniref:YciI family protein n=1 Tax=Paenibacillus soyae TaxID=2969249 RepID=A0A9X2SAI9_9BACL|nr:YciI family protein [Paenibacillus soyae]MCR2806749.1 YciI family protein [Paenibacillus soyae]